MPLDDEAADNKRLVSQGERANRRNGYYCCAFIENCFGDRDGGCPLLFWLKCNVEKQRRNTSAYGPGNARQSSFLNHVACARRYNAARGFVFNPGA